MTAGLLSKLMVEIVSLYILSTSKQNAELAASESCRLNDIPCGDSYEQEVSIVLTSLLSKLISDTASLHT